MRAGRTWTFRRPSIGTELLRAIDRDELRLLYQPLVNLRTGRVAGFEALSRWTRDDGTVVSPGEFIPMAEKSSLIVALGRWAVDKSARQLATWDREAGMVLPFYIGVNLSPVQVSRDDIPSLVHKAIGSSGIAAERLMLELTETAIIQDPVRAAKVFEALKEIGARVGLDDFGTGYSNLGYLRRLPLDMLKIDRSFVTDMVRNADSAAIVCAILGLASALGISTTAEGIESAGVADTLAYLGCANGQGYYYAEPLEPDEALAFWKRRAARP